MNALAGWFIFVGLVLVGDGLSDIAKAVEDHGRRCHITGIKKGGAA